MSIPAGYRPIPFPAFWFSERGTHVVVQNADDLRALGPGWYDTPDQRKWPKAIRLARPDMVRVDAPATVTVNIMPAEGIPTIQQLVAEEQAAAVPIDDVAMAAFHNRKVADINAEVGRSESVATLKQMLTYEPFHPQYKGGRPNVLKALRGRLKFLGD